MRDGSRVGGTGRDGQLPAEVGEGRAREAELAMEAEPGPDPDPAVEPGPEPVTDPAADPDVEPLHRGGFRCRLCQITAANRE